MAYIGYLFYVNLILLFCFMCFITHVKKNIIKEMFLQKLLDIRKHI